MEARADSVVLMRPENRLPFGTELRDILEREWSLMTQLEVDVSHKKLQKRLISSETVLIVI